MAAPGIKVLDKTEGRHRYVSPEEARQGLLKGYMSPGEERVRIGKGNDTGTVDAAEAIKAIDQGWELIDDEDARSRQIAREESGLLGQAQGVVEAGVSGLTLGASDWIIQGHEKSKGGAEAREGLQRYQARAKAAGAAGDVARFVGEAAPVLLSGGTGALAKTGAAVGKRGLLGSGRALLGKVGAAPLAVDAVGAAAERGAVKLLGSGLRGRTAGALARGGVEGFASGVGQEIHESVLGDREITAERLLAAGGMGALMGGAASGAFPLVGAAARGTAKVPASAMRKVLAKATKSAPENMGPAAEWVSTMASGRVFEPIKKQADLLKSKEGRQLAYDALHNAEAVTERAANVARKEIDNMNESISRVLRKTEADRTTNMGKLFSRADDASVPDMVRRDLEAASDRILGDEGLGIVERYGSGEMRKKVLDDAKGAIERAWEDVVEGLDAAGAHKRLLGTKRRLQQMARDVGRKDAASEATSNLLTNVSRQLDDALSRDQYGAASVAYKEMRDADRLALQSNDKLFARGRDGSKKGRNVLGRILSPDEITSNADIMTFTKRVGNAKYADQAELADDFFERQIQAMEVRAKHSGDAAVKADVKALRKQQKELKRTLREQAKVADIIDANRASGRGGLSGVLAAMGPSGAAVSGAVLGGAPGMAVGAALNALARPAQTIRTLAAVGHLADKAGLDLDGIVSRVTSVGSAVKSSAKRGAARTAKAGKKAKPRRKALRSAAARGAAQHTNRRSQEQREKSQRAAMLADPDELTRAIASDMHHLTEAAPGLAGAAADTVHRAAEFLASKLPPETVDPISGSKRIVDEGTRDKFDRYYEAVTEPVEALKRLENGTFTVEHSEAIREVWPALYADMQEKVMEGMQAAADRGEVLPFSRRISLGILFQLPTDPSMEPGMQARLQALHIQAGAEEAAQEEAQAGGAPEPGERTRKTTMKSTGNLATPLGRIERQDV